MKGVVDIKFTILLTQECNLACTYCYITKHPSKMTSGTAKKVADFVFTRTSKTEKNNIAFFGGEPLLDFGLMKEVVGIIEQHPRFRDFPIEFSVVTNGTIFTDEISDFLLGHDITYCLSCDGDHQAQDMSRRYKNGEKTSEIVEAIIKKAVSKLPVVLVNAVYSPKTLSLLPDTVRYFIGLGLKRIYLNADYSAKWGLEDTETLEKVLADVVDIYTKAHESGNPVNISIIDEKISVLLSGGYKPADKCHMGKKEFAFSPEGNIFPCERIVYDGSPSSPHYLGNVETGIDLDRLSCNMCGGGEANEECLTCGIRKYCMNWCGCSNYHSSGYYNRVGAFLCAEEKTLVKAALHILEAHKEISPKMFS